MRCNLKQFDIMTFIIMMLPIVDCLNTVAGVKISLVVRGAFLLFFVIYSLFFLKSKYKKLSIFIFTCLFLFLTIYLVHYYSLYSTAYIFVEIKTIIKFLYMPVLTVCFINYYDSKDFNISDIFLRISIFYSLLIIIPSIFGVGINSYINGKKGVSGLFFSPNEISNILAILIPFVLIKLFDDKQSRTSRIVNQIALLGIMVSCFLIGTKVPVFGLWISILACIIISIIRSVYSSNYIRYVFLFLAVGAVSLIMYNYSFLNYNISLQSNTYTNVEEKDIAIDKKDQGANKSIIKNTEYINFPLNPISIEYKDSKILNLLFSSRNIYLQNNMTKWVNSNISEKAFGLTLGISKDAEEITNMTELDVIDVLMYYGVFGVIILLVYVLFIVIVSLLRIIVHLKESVFDNNLMAVFLSFSIGVLISVVAGHTLSAPAVTTFLAIDGSFLLLDSGLFNNCSKWNYRWHYIVLVTIACMLFCFAFLSFKQYSDVSINIDKSEGLLSDDISLNKHLTVEYENIVDELYYYYPKTYHNLQIIFVNRTIDKNIKEYFFTFNNTGNSELTVSLDLENKKNYSYSDIFDYVLEVNKLGVKSKYAIKELNNIYNYSKGLISSLTVPTNSSIDFYIIDSPSKIEEDNMPWLSFNGYYALLEDNIYYKDIYDYDIDDYSKELQDIMKKNYLIYSNYYSMNDGEKWFQEYDSNSNLDITKAVNKKLKEFKH